MKLAVDGGLTAREGLFERAVRRSGLQCMRSTYLGYGSGPTRSSQRRVPIDLAPYPRSEEPPPFTGT